MDWKVRMDEHIHTGEEIALRLQNKLQYWYIKNGCIQRKYCTSGWNETLLVIDTVAQLAKATLHDPDLTASGAFVIVKLKTHSAKVEFKAISFTPSVSAEKTSIVSCL